MADRWVVTTWGAALSDDGCPRATGRTLDGATHDFRAFDDDGALYAAGVATSESACEMAHDYLSANYGSTRSQIRPVGTTKWVDFI